MKTKKITLLLMLTVISLLTIFLAVLLDDTVLAATDAKSPILQNLNLLEMAPQGMVVELYSEPGNRLSQDDLKLTKAVWICPCFAAAKL